MKKILLVLVGLGLVFSMNAQDSLNVNKSYKLTRIIGAHYNMQVKGLVTYDKGVLLIDYKNKNLPNTILDFNLLKNIEGVVTTLTHKKESYFLTLTIMKPNSIRYTLSIDDKYNSLSMEMKDSFTGEITLTTWVIKTIKQQKL